MTANNQILHDWQKTPSGKWNGQTALGGSATQMALGQNRDGRLELFYVTPDGSVCHNWQKNKPDVWNGEAALGSKAKQLTIGHNKDGRLELISIGQDDKL